MINLIGTLVVAYIGLNLVVGAVCVGFDLIALILDLGNSNRNNKGGDNDL